MRTRMLWNHDEGTGGGTASPDTSTTPPPASSTEPPPSDPLRGMQAALAAERKARQELQSKLEALTAAQQTAADEERAKNGEALSLLKERDTELKTLKEQVKAMRAAEQARLDALTEQNAARTKALPEALRALVPAGLDPEATRTQIERIEALVGAGDAAPLGTISRAPGRKEEPIPPECQAEAAAYGRDPRKHFETVWKPRQARRGK